MTGTMEVNSVKILVFPSNMCRICVDFKENVQTIQDTLVSYENNAISLLEVLNLFSDIELNEGYPNNICSNCLTKAAKAYHFKLQCDKSTRTIQQLQERVASDVTIPEITIQEPDSQEEIEEIKIVSEISVEDGSFDVNEEIKENNEEKNSTQEETPFYCSMCGKYFTDEAALMEHTQKLSKVLDGNEVISGVEVVPRPKTKTHICELCNKQYKKASLLKYHMRVHTNDRPYVCNICGKGYVMNYILLQHVREYHKEVQLEGPRKIKCNPRRTGGKGMIRPYACPICGQAYSNKYSFLKHSAAHVEEEQFQCEKCGEEFSKCLQFFQHILLHQDPSPFKCKQCNKSFSRKLSVKRHEEIVHSELKKYLCCTCGKTFSTRTHLGEHILTHSIKEKEHQCEECGKKFALPVYLRRHIKLVHRDNSFHCKECGKAFRGRSAIKYHELLHSGHKPHVCKICNRGFIVALALKYHMRVHTNDRTPPEKRFKCTQCEMAFSSKYILRNHEVTHTDLKPFVCVICDKQYRQKATLNRHMKTHIVEEERPVRNTQLTEDSIYQSGKKEKHSRREISRSTWDSS